MEMNAETMPTTKAMRLGETQYWRGLPGRTDA